LTRLHIYTQAPSSRVDYIFSTLLNALGVKDFIVTTDLTFFSQQAETKINYSAQRITDNEFWIQPANLLFETGIKEQEITCFNYPSSKAFFKTPDCDFPFDIFAASFYLISRYEEYLPHKKDMYGRYAHENSLAYKENFLQLPLVNLWLKEFGEKLTKKLPSLPLNPKPFTFLPTYDIDIAFSYLHKSAARNLGGFIKSMWHSDWALVTERMNVLFGKQQDPFDSYQWLNELHDAHQLKPLYFFLVPAKNKEYDKNILPEKQVMKKLIKQHAERYEVGIHPSWQSGDEPTLLKQEIEKLEKIIGKKITKSRQHYIRMDLPDTYTRLIDAGIAEDYSMGYGSINGFRASYCLPYLWYDLRKEETTNLTIYPFCYMDANSYYEQHFNCEEALKEMTHYYNITRQVNGWFITIWHNHFLGTDKMFRGWREVYRTFCQNLDLLDLKD
jgi:hypothetical protein